MKKTIITTLAALMLIASVAIAQPGHRNAGKFAGDGPHGFGMTGQMGQRGAMLLAHADAIGLTDEQVEKIQDLHIAHRLALVDKKAEIEKAQIKLRALRRDNESTDKVGAAIDELSRLRAGMQKTNYAHQQEVHGLLTEEQLDKLKEFRRSGKGHHGARRGPGGPGGNMPGMRGPGGI